MWIPVLSVSRPKCTVQSESQCILALWYQWKNNKVNWRGKPIWFKNLHGNFILGLIPFKKNFLRFLGNAFKYRFLICNLFCFQIWTPSRNLESFETLPSWMEASRTGTRETSRGSWRATTTWGQCTGNTLIHPIHVYHRSHHEIHMYICRGGDYMEKWFSFAFSIVTWNPVLHLACDTFYIVSCMCVSQIMTKNVPFTYLWNVLTPWAFMHNEISKMINLQYGKGLIAMIY